MVFLLFFMNALQDIRKREIFLTLTCLIALAGMIRGFLTAAAGEGMLWDIFLRQCMPAILPGILLFLLAILTSGKFGCGDALSVLAAGFWTDGETLVMTCLAAFALVPAAAAGAALLRRPRREWPFQPFLCAAWILCRLRQLM